MHKPQRSSNPKLRNSQPALAVVDNCKIHQLAFDSSLQANIIFNVSTGEIITANAAAGNLLGYSEQELLAQNRSTIFKVNEVSFKKMMRQRRAEGQSKALATAVTRSGRLLPCEITSAVFTDEDGTESSIYTIVDISERIQEQKDIDIQKEKIVADNIDLAKDKQKKITEKREKAVAKDIVAALAKSAARLEENNEWIKYIAKTSYDVMWDWNIATGQIYVSDSVEEVFGYKVQNNTIAYTDFIENLLPEEKERVEKKIGRILATGSKSWKDTYMVRCRNGSLVATTTRASIVRDEMRQATHLIGAIQDVSKLHELKTKWGQQASQQHERSEMFVVADGLSVDIIWDWNILTNEVHIGEGFEELFGYAVQDNKVSIESWRNYLHPEDREAVKQGLYDAIASIGAHWSQAYRFIRADGSIATVFGRGSIMRQADGKAYRMIGSMQDLSRQKILEERLEQEIRLKEKQIENAMEDAKEAERCDIGKELHDNVNQLLGTSRLYLSMAREGGEEGEMYLNRSSEYMLTAIEEIRKLTKALTTDTIKNIGLVEAIQDMVQDTMEVKAMEITCLLDGFVEQSVNEKFKINVFRIIQEQLGNILKHAAASKVTIELLQDKTFICLSIADNGVGFDTAKKRDGIGIANINSRAAAFHGTIDFASQPGQGCVLTIVFPLQQCAAE
jgi:PAS domain S-box-containing protein